MFSHIFLADEEKTSDDIEAAGLITPPQYYPNSEVKLKLEGKDVAPVYNPSQNQTNITSSAHTTPDRHKQRKVSTAIIPDESSKTMASTTTTTGKMDHASNGGYTDTKLLQQSSKTSSTGRRVPVSAGDQKKNAWKPPPYGRRSVAFITHTIIVQTESFIAYKTFTYRWLEVVLIIKI